MKYQEIHDALVKAREFAAVVVLEGLKAEERRARPDRRPRSSQAMTPELADEIWLLHRSTELTNSQIAARLNVNQGRISEVIASRRSV